MKFVFFIILVLAAIFAFIFGLQIKSTEMDSKRMARILRTRRTIALGISAILVLIAFATCWTFIPTGFTAIPVTFGKVGNTTYEAGPHLIGPFTNIIKMDNREQRNEFEFLAFSKDLQEVAIRGSVNYSIDKGTAMDLYRTVGVDYVKILLSPQLVEDTKVVFASYSAEQLIAQRAALSTQIEEMLRPQVGEKGIQIINVNIADIDFSDAYTESIEAKQVATQNALRAKTEQDQKTMETQAAADRAAIEAQANADVARIEAEAEADVIRMKAAAEAEANEKIAASITEELADYRFKQLWNGVAPKVIVAGDSGDMMMDFSSMFTESDVEPVQ